MNYRGFDTCLNGGVNVSEKKQTKQCKYCKTEIPADAKICPNCKKRQRPGGCLIAVLVVVVVVIVLAVVGGSSSDAGTVVNDTPPATESTAPTASSQQPEVTQAPQEEPVVYGVGDTAQCDGVEVTLQTMEQNAGQDYLYPEEGNVFVALQFEIVNNSDADLSVSSMLSFEAYCDDYSINQSLTGASLYPDSTLDGTVAVGKKLGGTIVYEVPADWQQLDVSFAPSVWVDQAVNFVVTNEG